MTESMTGSVEQFKQSFREEAREILVDLEAALLELHDNRADNELVASVFRGLHTLKGSGAMFGFEEMAAFTHSLETAFDLVRNGELEVDSVLVDLTLAALDQIRAMLEESTGVVQGNAAACAEILVKVRQLAGIPATGIVDKGIVEKTGDREEETLKARQPFAQEMNGAAREWAIQFAPGPDLLLNGTDPFLLLKELRGMGGLSVRACMDGLPALAELEPERCYVSWEMVLSTKATEDEIRDVFVFVDDLCELKIDAVAGGAEAAQVCEARHEEYRPEERIPSGSLRGSDKPEQATSLRVPAAKLDQFVDLVGELVTVQARLSELAGRREDAEVSAVAEEIERLTSSLRENSMNIRMVPVRATFEKFRRLVHDLARDLGKEVELSIEGAETELDKTVIEKLSDPLMHLIRNSMDHGIETPDARVAAGKAPIAEIHLSAKHSGASVLIGVSDDGGGIDSAAVRARAVEKGLVNADADLTEAEIFALILEPGFSTAAQVTDVSGRGVGMDVVRRNVESLRGSIEIGSKAGQGTNVTLRMPLTLAIIDGLLVKVGAASFVLPLANTLECIELTRNDIEQANGKHVVNMRGEIIPYIRLREYFNIHAGAVELEQIMVVETVGGRYGFVVDQVLGDCQTVIKNLGQFYRQVQVVSGATILGNGTVALILDPERLAQEAVRAIAERPRGHPQARIGRRQAKEGLPARGQSFFSTP